ncbi:NUDIX hydrolase [Planococcus alpniumensis]|uniref:NUDIX hydrolase n=1 Tax=Planococcus alpniumensis TaxID=2708345 RepID=UPI001B8B579E|nr:NUDIX domain-containing protein [Planococcus sp. MSAK28401]
MSNSFKIVVALKGVIVNDGEVLIVQRIKDDEVGGGTWECAGGKLEFGEALEGSLLREIKEEVDLDVVVEKLLYATTFKTDLTRQVVILTYLCSSSNREVLLSEEHVDYEWANKDQLKLRLPQEIVVDFEKNNVFSLDVLH